MTVKKLKEAASKLGMCDMGHADDVLARLRHYGLKGEALRQLYLATEVAA